MNDFFDMSMYVITMLGRATLSFLLCVISLTGLSIAATNNLKHNYFEFLYFLLVFLVELGMAGFYLYLYRRQRGLTDLGEVSQLDCKVSCLVLFTRLGWHFGLGLFNVVRINVGGYI